MIAHAGGVQLPRQPLAVVLGKRQHGTVLYAAVSHALDAIGPGLGAGQGRQQHACEDAHYNETSKQHPADDADYSAG